MNRMRFSRFLLSLLVSFISIALLVSDLAACAAGNDALNGEVANASGLWDAVSNMFPSPPTPTPNQEPAPVSEASNGITVVQPTGYFASDYSGVLSDAAKNHIETNAKALENATGAQIVFVTLDTTSPTEIRDYALALFNSWGIGDAQKNNGILVILAIQDDDYYTMEGTGLESDLPVEDLKAMWSEYLEPDFARKDYSSGCIKYFDALFKKVVVLYNVELEPSEAAATTAIDKASPAQTKSDDATTAFEYLIKNGEVTITGYRGDDPDVVIPDAIEGIPVTEVGRCAFQYREDIRSVVLPDSLLRIGEVAFDQCFNLNSIAIPGRTTSIGACAFGNCWALSRMEIPGSVEQIGENAFWACSGLKSVVMEDGVSTISGTAFGECAALTDIYLPPSVTHVEGNAFSGCRSIRRLITFPGSYADHWAETQSALRALIVHPTDEADFTYELQDGLLTIVGYQGSGGDVLIPWIINGQTVRRIGAYSYQNSAVSSLELPEGIQHIESRAFESSAIPKITFPDSLISIGESAFVGCGSLTGIMIPASVSEIGSGAFSGCGSLPEIKVSSGNAYFVASDGVLFSRDMKKLISYPNGKTGSSYTVPDRVDTLVDGAFAYCGLTSIKLPDSIREIGFFCFYQSALTGITLPEGLISIGEAAFCYCYRLNGVRIPRTVTRIENAPFYSCSSLTEIGVESGNPAYASIDGVLFDIGGTVLMQYPAGNPMAHYDVPEGTSAIAPEAFAMCNYLTSVALPSSLKEIDDWAFISCDNLESVIVPTGVETIDEMAFMHDEKLTLLGDPGSYAETYAANSGIPFQEHRPLNDASY